MNDKTNRKTTPRRRARARRRRYAFLQNLRANNYPKITPNTTRFKPDRTEKNVDPFE